MDDGELTRDGLQVALDGLVREQTLSREQASAVLSAVGAASVGSASVGSASVVPREPQHRGSWVPLLAEVGGYVGGAFVVAATAVLTGPQWGRFGTSERVAILAVPAVALLAAAVAIAVTGSRSGPRGRLIAALVLVTGGLLAGVTAVLVHGDAEPTLVPLTAFVVWAAGYLGQRTALLHVGSAGAAALAVGLTEAWWFEGSDGVAWAGWLLLGLAAAWLALTVLRVLREQVLGKVTAATLGFLGSELLVLATDGSGQRAVGYLVLAAVAVACFAGYLAEHEVAVLAAGVVALAVVVPQAVIDYTDGALGAGGALLVTGLSIVAASVLGLRVRRDAVDATA